MSVAIHGTGYLLPGRYDGLSDCAALKAVVIPAWIPESSDMDGKFKNKLIHQNRVLIRNNDINIKSLRSGVLKLRNGNFITCAF